MQRHAIYFAPAPETALARFGAGWLGRDAASDMPVGQPTVDGLDLRTATEEPRRYGFHATLKAPFELADHRTESQLMDALGTYAAGRRPIPAGALRVAALGAFVAFVFRDPAPAVDLLAADVVRAFDPFRRALSPADVRRRLAAQLSERQRLYVERWGYPFVFDEFHFHMTLTGPLPAATRQRFVEHLSRSTMDVRREALVIDALVLFRQADRDAPFRWVARFPLGG